MEGTIKTIKSILLKYTDPKAEYSGITAHEIASIIYEATTEKAQTLKAYQRINGCPHDLPCTCFMQENNDDVSDEISDSMTTRSDLDDLHQKDLGPRD